MILSAPPGGVVLRDAGEHDLPVIADRIRFWAERHVLLPLDGPMLRTMLPDFRVLALADNARCLVAFGALRRYSHRLAEIRSLVVSDDHQGRGHGRRLVSHLLEEARGEGLRRVFVLTRFPPLFERLGFRRVVRDSLPQKVFVDCSTCARRDQCDEIALVMDLA